MEEKPKTIYFTDDPDTGIVHPGFMTGDDPSEAGSGAVPVLIISIVLLAVIAVLFCLTYYK